MVPCLARASCQEVTLASLSDDELQQVLEKALPPLSALSFECFESIAYLEKGIQGLRDQASSAASGSRIAAPSSSALAAAKLAASVRARETLASVCKRFRSIVHNASTRLILAEALSAAAMLEYHALSHLHLVRGCTQWPLPKGPAAGPLRSLSRITVSEDMDWRVSDWAAADFTSAPNIAHVSIPRCYYQGRGDSAAFLRAMSFSTTLRHLNLRDGSLDDEGLKHLSGLSALTHLNLCCTTCREQRAGPGPGQGPVAAPAGPAMVITHAGVHSLRRLTALTYLNLSHRHVQDAGIAHLSTLTQLHHLSVADCGLSGPGLCSLGSLKQLHTLDISQCTDLLGQLPFLARFPQLKHIGLSKCAGLQHSSMQVLEELRQEQGHRQRLCVHGFGDGAHAECHLLFLPVLPLAPDDGEAH